MSTNENLCADLDITANVANSTSMNLGERLVYTSRMYVKQVLIILQKEKERYDLFTDKELKLILKRKKLINEVVQKVQYSIEQMDSEIKYSNGVYKVDINVLTGPNIAQKYSDIISNALYDYRYNTKFTLPEPEPEPKVME